MKISRIKFTDEEIKQFINSDIEEIRQLHLEEGDSIQNFEHESKINDVIECCVYLTYSVYTARKKRDISVDETERAEYYNEYFINLVDVSVMIDGYTISFEESSINIKLYDTITVSE